MRGRKLLQVVGIANAVGKLYSTRLLRTMSSPQTLSRDLVEKIILDYLRDEGYNVTDDTNILFNHLHPLYFVEFTEETDYD